jgi:hypothetical protein
MKKSGCVLWAGVSYRPGNTVVIEITGDHQFKFQCDILTANVIY